MDDLFTVNSFTTLALCVLACVVLVNTARHVFGWGPRWFAWVIGLIISSAAYWLGSHAGTSKTTDVPAFLQILIVLLNGSLIYTSAFGIQNNMVSVPEKDKPAGESTPRRPHWRRAW